MSTIVKICGITNPADGIEAVAAGADAIGLMFYEASPRYITLDAATEIAREIASKSPLAVKRAKRMLNTVEEMPVRDAYRYEQTVTVELSHTEDAKEAQRAFIEKRKPVWKGK